MAPTDSEKKPNVEPLLLEQPAETKKSRFWVSRLFLTVFFLAIVGVALWFGRQTAEDSLRNSGLVVQSRVEDATLLPRIEALEKQAKLSDEKIAQLEQRESKTEPSGAQTETHLAPAVPTEEVERLRRDLSSLSSVLVQIEGQVKQSSQSSDQARNASLATAEAVIGFVRLQAALYSGGNFEAELKSFRKTMEGDPSLASVWERLEPLAQEGVLPISDLRGSLASLEAPLVAAIRKSQAKTWTERLFAAVQSLISVHRVGRVSDEEATLAAIDQDLFDRNISKASEKVDALPEAAKALLKDWRKQLEAHKTADEALALFADRLISRASQTSATPPAEPSPEAF